MKFFYFIWLLSCDARILQLLCIGCVVLAILCYSARGLKPQGRAMASPHSNAFNSAQFAADLPTV
jgi:hypothetical protein